MKPGAEALLLLLLILPHLLLPPFFLVFFPSPSPFIFSLPLLLRLGSRMAAAGVSGSGPTSETLDDYSPYSHLSDDELLQLAIQRSLSDTQHNAGTPAGGQALGRADGSDSTPTQRQQPTHTSRSAPPATAAADRRSHNASAEYSSPNPPWEKPPDPYVCTRFLHAVN